MSTDTAPLPLGAIPTVSVSFDPNVKRIFVLTTTEMQFGEPSPQISTKTWSFSSQFKSFVRALQHCLHIVVTRHDDEVFDDETDKPVFDTDIFDKDDSINEDLEELIKYQPDISGLNGYNEKINEKQFEKLTQCWEKIAKFFKKYNNLHDGNYHGFLFSRYIINDIEKKTFSREINIHLATRQDLIEFFR
jgi:hypothetical protein